MLDLVQLIVLHRHGQRTSYLPQLDEIESKGSPQRLCNLPVSLSALQKSGVWFNPSWFASSDVPRIALRVADGSSSDLRKVFSDEALRQVDGPVGGGVCHPGQLTDKGKQTLRDLGLSLRTDYGTFIGLVDSKSSFFRSSPYIRTIESLQYLVSGLLPNQKEILVNVKSHETLFPDVSHCRSLKELVEPFQEIALLKHKQTLREISAKVDELYPGVEHRENNHPHATILDRGEFGVLNKYFDAFSCWRGVGTGAFSLPPDSNHRQDVEQVLNVLTNVANDLLFGSFRDAGLKNPTVYSLGIGRLWREIGEVIDTRFDPTKQEKVKLAVFSGHDTTIAPLLSSLGLFNGELTKWPGFGSNVTIEVYKEDGVQSSPSYDNHYVRMKYNGEKLILPQCQKQSFWKKSTPANYRGDPTLCRLDIFMNAIEKIIPEAYEADCK